MIQHEKKKIKNSTVRTLNNRYNLPVSFFFSVRTSFSCVFPLFSCRVRISTERPDVLDEEATAVIIVLCAAQCSQFEAQILGVNVILLRFSPFTIWIG